VSAAVSNNIQTDIRQIAGDFEARITPSGIFDKVEPPCGPRKTAEAAN